MATSCAAGGPCYPINTVVEAVGGSNAGPDEPPPARLFNGERGPGLWSVVTWPLFPAADSDAGPVGGRGKTDPTMTRKSAAKDAARARQAKYGGKHESHLRTIGGITSDRPPEPSHVWDERLAHTHGLAMREHLRPRSAVLLMDDPDAPPVDKPPPNGSATCIEIGGRHFVATAAHNLNNLESLRNLSLGAFGEIGKFTRLSPKLINKGRRGGWDYDRVDIAWLEIEPRAVPSWTEEWGRRFVTLDRMWLGKAADVDKHVCCLGQAYESLKFLTVNGIPTVGFRPLPYLSGTKRSEDPEHQMWVHYARVMHSMEGQKDAPDPAGFSGCGLWFVNPKQNGLWTPERAQLAAIEHGWLPESECLTGTLMRHWVQMIREDIPELAHFIDPFLKPTENATP